MGINRIFRASECFSAIHRVRVPSSNRAHIFARRAAVTVSATAGTGDLSAARDGLLDRPLRRAASRDRAGVGEYTLHACTADVAGPVRADGIEFVEQTE